LLCGNCGSTNPDGASFCNVCGNSFRAPTDPTTPSFGSQSTPPPTGGTPFQFSNAFSNAIALVTNPTKFLKDHKDTPVTVKDVLVNYVAIIAAVPFIATLLEWVLSYYGFIEYGFVAAIFTYVLDVVSVFIIGFIIWKLGPTFGTQADQSRSTLLAAAVYTPALLISILGIIPFLGVLSFLGLLYGIYILYLGLPIMFNTPSDKVIIYVGAVLVASFIVAYIMGYFVDYFTYTAILHTYGLYY